ncbi:MAG: ABC transporter permease [Candidatus Cloacimonetes bacterium]|jgi:spermidine/putrescine transport system permease protein|nr:ABC transporter permease [Candidatus Cloacimonadota bacterium]MDD4156425.1 ABC transporter permease [Candidatus Cloacimonadota bacterium]
MNNELRAQRKKEISSWILSLPALIWLLVFFLIPYFIILLYSFFESGIYDVEPILTLSAYKEVLTKPYISSFYLSIKLAFYTTVICLIAGYPVAYVIARASEKYKNLLIILIVIPFWTNFVIRIFSWRIFLAPDGLLNTMLIGLNFINDPIRLLRTDFAVLLVMVYVYLPYMILPLYSAIEKIDFSLLDAAMDLGANPIKAFLKITLPLSKQGILAGTILVFIPALGAYIIPQLVGNQNSLLIGQVITYKIKNIPRNWPVASALSFFLVLLIGVFLLVFYYLNKRVKQKGIIIDEE